MKKDEIKDFVSPGELEEQRLIKLEKRIGDLEYIIRKDQIKKELEKSASNWRRSWGIKE